MTEEKQTGPAFLDYGTIGDPQKYFELHREEVTKILHGEVQVPGAEDVAVGVAEYADKSITNLLGTIEAQKGDIELHRRRKYSVPIGAGVVALVIGVLGGTYYGDSRLRPDYNKAVANYQQTFIENQQLADAKRELQSELKGNKKKVGELEAVIEEKDDMIKEYKVIFEKQFGKPPEKSSQ